MSMKFFCKVRYNDSFYVLPPQQQGQLLMTLAAFTDKYVKAGKISDVYIVGDGKEAMFMWNVASNEEWLRVIYENPMRPWANFEIAPVLEWEVAQKLMKERVENLQKSAK